VRDPNQLAPPATLFHLAPDQTRRSPPSKGFGPTTPYVWPLSNMRWETQRSRNWGHHWWRAASRKAARLCRREWMNRWARCCVRGPSSSTGRSAR